MNQQEILFNLENKDRCKNFIFLLKQAGGKSHELRSLGEIMNSLGMHKTPRGIDQTTILQHTFAFCNIRDCFRDFRLVSKAWKFAVETQRFSHPDGFRILQDFDWHYPNENFRYGYFPPINNAIFKSLKNLTFCFPCGVPFGDNGHFDALSKLILQNMSRLNTLQLSNTNPLPPSYDAFILNLLQNSNTTLKNLVLPKFLLPDVSFSNLLHLNVPVKNMSLQELQPQLEQMLKNAPNLERLSLDVRGMKNSVEKYLISNYAEQCTIYSGEVFMPFPVKMVDAGGDVLKCAENFQFKHTLEYMRVLIHPDAPSEEGWEDYQNIFSNFPKLKGLAFYDAYDDNLEDDDFLVQKKNGSISKKYFGVWNKRRNFLCSLGIKILNKNEFYAKEKELSKHLPWAFHFYSTVHHIF